MHPSSLNGRESFKQGEKGKVIFQTYDDDIVIYAGMNGDDDDDIILLILGLHALLRLMAVDVIKAQQHRERMLKCLIFVLGNKF